MNFFVKNISLKGIRNLFFLGLVFSSCTAVRKYQKDRPFFYKNNITVVDPELTKKEKNELKSRLYTQLDDSSKVIIKDFAFFLQIIKKPPVFDTVYVANTAGNMKGLLIHSGYYSPVISYTFDTTHSGQQKRISVNYRVEPGKPTIIDTVSYEFRNADLKSLAVKTGSSSFLIKNNIVTKSDILAETNRLIELYRNNGYYKFSSDNIKVMGDTSLEILTNISDDPFENLRLIAESKAKRDKPTIKLALTENEDMDSTTTGKYFINNVYIYPDYSSIDTLNNINYKEEIVRGFIIRYHKALFKNSFLIKNLFLRKGDVYRQDRFTRTINNFSKNGVWQSVNIQAVELKDNPGKLDLIIQMIPSKKFGFEANIESSYSTNNSYTLGNLLGFSGNLSLQNRNVGKEAIKMTHAIRAGVEFNVSKNKSTNGIINSNELGYSNTITIPRLVTPSKKLNDTRLYTKQSFINTNVSYTNRYNLFKLQSYNFAFGYDWSKKKNRSNVLKLINFEFSYLYNRSDSFVSTLNNNPYLKYSFNTAMVLGTSYSYSSVHYNQKKKWQRDFKLNIEESGFPWSSLGISKKYLRKFIKTDAEISWTKTFSKSAHVFRLFGGIGIPLDKKDSSLPFFKQYFAGGANSMRAWPVRGIGQGAKPLSPYGTSVFNDRTGDVRLEANYEYRYNIAQIIPNTLYLKGALFIDAGNIWNFRNTQTGGGPDSLQFRFENLYKQLAVTGGTGFRLDFNYFLIRFDLGFRFKRPDVLKDNGWQLPEITFNNLFKRGIKVPNTTTPDPNDTINDERYKKWRYENFNFTIGISYPF